MISRRAMKIKVTVATAKVISALSILGRASPHGGMNCGKVWNPVATVT
jgi:hypothetical protein